MFESFKKFRQRHLSNDPIIAFFALTACGKTTPVQEIAHHKVMRKDDGEIKSGNENLFSSVAHTSGSESEFVRIRHPMVPNEIDHPIRCPRPEHGVIQDGRALKEKVPAVKRKGQLPFVTESEMQKLLWQRRSSPSDCQICSAVSAPEASFLNFLS